MTPNFTTINLITNTFYEFWEKEFAFDFSKSLRDSPDHIFSYSPDDHIQQKVKHFDSLFELAEGEITHNIFAGNTIIINSLFQQIKSFRNHIYPAQRSLQDQIRTWNGESYKEYEKKVNEMTSRYFENDKFVGLKHLDTFEDYLPEFPFDMGSFRPVTRTYYAFYCIEALWDKYFDLNHFDKYYSFIVEQSNKLVELFDKYIQRYDAGEFTQKEQDKPEKDTLLDKFTKWAQNNKLIVTFIILGLILTFIVTQWENVLKIIGWAQPTGKELSGIVKDKTGNSLSGVSVIFGEHGSKRDSTDSFGKFLFSDLQGEGLKTEIVQLKRNGYRDTSFAVKINYGSEEKPERLEIILNVKTDLDICIEGDVQACYRYADVIAKSCPPQDGQAHTACIFKAEMWRSVGDDYQEVLQLQKDSGETNSSYIKAVEVWKHHIEMANAMPEW